ncbi:hypothetical protein FRC19_011619, partial [Serendipita sp. 401]
MRSATPPQQLDAADQEIPLSLTTIVTILYYLIPPSTEGIPPHLLSKQQKLRHEYLKVDAAEDPASYFCLNPDHPSQNTNLVLSTLERLSSGGRGISRDGSILDDLIGRVVYHFDGEQVFAHVILAEAIQLCFVWESSSSGANPIQSSLSSMGNLRGHGEEVGWKYFDVKPLPLPEGASPSLEAVLQAGKKQVKGSTKLKRDASAVTMDGSTGGEDSYWSQYDHVAPSVSNGRASATGGLHISLARDGSAAGLSHRSLSPRREEAYWDRYGYADDDEDEEEGGGMVTFGSGAVLAPHHQLQPSTFEPDRVWGSIPSSKHFTPEQLSAALAMHLQPDLEPSTDVPQGLSLNLDTSDPTAPPFDPMMDLESPVSND